MKTEKGTEFKSYFDSITRENTLTKDVLLKLVSASGISLCDNRFGNYVNDLPDNIDYDIFHELILTNTLLFTKIIEQDLIIRDWVSFSVEINDIFLSCREHNLGKVADYIPQLAKVPDTLYGVSICTIDGQQLNLGDTNIPFCVQSCSKPITYLIAADLNSPDYVHNFIGREPSGRNFNELCLNSDKLPHNPLINSGAIMSTSLVNYREPIADRFDTIVDYWSKLAGNTKINFSNSVYLSERTTADRNYCIGYMMQEAQAFSRGKDIKYKREWNNNDLRDSLDLYFQCCSIEINCKQAAVIAATLSNGGVCPVTEQVVFPPDTVKNALSLMSSCGMYDYSGEWAYTIGIPAKSGVSGIIIGIIPNVMGIAVFSPKLDDIGNSSRGIEFFKKLTAKYPFHVYDNVLNSKKKSVINYEVTNEETNLYTLLSAAGNGDLKTIQAISGKGFDLNTSDYDGRTALHLAASEGNDEVVRYLLEKEVDKCKKDRWGNIPIDDANREILGKSTLVENRYEEIIRLLE